MAFVGKVREKRKKKTEMRKAVTEAVDECYKNK